jgi:hypothetical protein
VYEKAILRINDLFERNRVAPLQVQLERYNLCAIDELDGSDANGFVGQ